ncbi:MULTISPECIES: hypothetical protein [unclassified Microcoleus]|uniref:hypothetical protein n=1 Tax=unclassified Microcoleus TaxID=2642155 RepID=UPI002FD00B38
MITFYDNQPLFDANSTTNAIELKSKEENSELNKADYINDEKTRPFQTDINQRIQRVKENYFLERRTFL